MNKRTIATILTAVAVLVVGLVIVLATNNKDKSTTTNNTSNSTTSQTKQQTQTTNSIVIKDFGFNPATTTVKVGTKVTWTNQDSVDHTVTADSGTGPDSKLLGNGQSYSYTFSKAGTYTYHCSQHPDMKGTVIVTQ